MEGGGDYILEWSCHMWGLISIVGLSAMITKELTAERYVPDNLLSTVFNPLGLAQPQGHVEAVDSPSHRGGSSAAHPGGRGRTQTRVSLPPKPTLITSECPLAFCITDSAIFLASAFSTGIMRFPKL